MEIDPTPPEGVVAQPLTPPKEAEPPPLVEPETHILTIPPSPDGQ